MRIYEFTFLVQPGFVQQEVDGLKQELSSLLSKNGAKLEKYESWGLRDLAYPINKFTKAHYFLMYISSDPAFLNEFRRKIRLNENIIRYDYVLVDKVDEEDSFMVRSEE